MGMKRKIISESVNGIGGKSTRGEGREVETKARWDLVDGGLERKLIRESTNTIL